MGRKSSAKAQSASTPTPPSQGPPSKAPKRILSLILVALAIGGFAYWRQAESHSPAADVAAASTPAVPVDYQQPITKPHPQQNLPTLALPGYQTPRPPEVVRAAYQFAAEHPEVLSYVPCFCGCERSGHRGNEDCFVRERATNGDVISWDEHGMECAICLDVADRSRKLFASGSSVKEIRATIEREFGAHGPSHTPTPQPPGEPR